MAAVLSMKIRIRSDLLHFPRDEEFEPTWVIKDPLTFEHFLFSQREYFLLNQLNGSQSEEDIVRLWRENFKTKTLSLDQLQQFIRRLIQDKLVVVDQLGYGDPLHEEQLRHRNRIFAGLLLNPLAIRFRGFNPGPWLRQLDWLGWLLFHPLTMVFSLSLALIVFLFTFGHFEDVAARIPAIEQILSAKGLLAIALTVALIKVIHELAHALACRRFGGECFEIGIILLAFIPTLYCNVSDAWTFARRWQRMVVSFAGMYVEILMAAVAAVVWLATPPCLLNALLFNVVLLCSVNTLLINGNPLLRYDGYYLLADGWNKPNLGAMANLAATRFWWSWLGFSEPTNTVSTGVLIYGLLASAYRWFVLLAIAGGIIWLIGQAGSFSLGYFVAGILMAGIVLTTIGRNVAIAKRSHWRGVSSIRLLCTLGLLGGIGWLVFVVPLPCSIFCGAVVEVTDPVRIYATNGGQIEFISPNYASVTTGQPIVRIKNPSLQRRRQIKQNELERYQAQLRQLELRFNEDATLAGRISAAKQKQTALSIELELLNQEIQGLTIESPVDGVIYPVAAKPKHLLDELDSQHWEGYLNDPKNLGYVVSRGDHLFDVGTQAAPSVFLIIGEANIPLVEVGQPVRIRFEQFPGPAFSGEAIKIHHQDLPVNQAYRNSELNSIRDLQGNQHFTQTPYRVEVGNLEVPAEVQPGSTGRARISVRQQTLAQRLERLIKTSLAKQGSQ